MKNLPWRQTGMHEQGVEVNAASRNTHERCRSSRWPALSESPLVLPTQVAPVCLGLAVKQKVRTDHPNRQLLGRPGRLIAVWMTVLLSMDMAGGTDSRIGRTSRTPARAGPDAGGISAATSATVRSARCWRRRP